MPKLTRRPPTPARVPPEDFRYAGYKIVGQPNSQNWYRQWREKGVNSTKRRSLDTEDFEEAKKELVAFVAREFSDEDAMRGDPLVSSVLDGFWEDPMEKIPCQSTFRLLRAYVGKHWQSVTLHTLTPGLRKEFANSVIARGCGPGHAANQLCLLSRAFAWAGEPRDDGRILCPDPPSFPVAVTWVVSQAVV